MPPIFRTKNGDKCDSDFERAVIDDLIERGVRYKYEDRDRNVLYFRSPVINGICDVCEGTKVFQRRYRTIDILLEDSGILVEVKGKFPAHVRTLMGYLVKDNPETDLRFFFMRNAWMTKRKARTYLDWARTKGVPAVVGDPRQTPGTKAYGVGGIPEDWVK